MAQAKAKSRSTAKTTRKPRSRAKPRQRLLEEQTETALRRRGVELIGLALLLIGAVLGTMLATYNPADPSLFTATDAPPTNARSMPHPSLTSGEIGPVGLMTSPGRRPCALF